MPRLSFRVLALMAGGLLALTVSAGLAAPGPLRATVPGDVGGALGALLGQGPETAAHKHTPTPTATATGTPTATATPTVTPTATAGPAVRPSATPTLPAAAAHGQTVSETAHETEPGPCHGVIVSAVARDLTPPSSCTTKEEAKEAREALREQAREVRGPAHEDNPARPTPERETERGKGRSSGPSHGHGPGGSVSGQPDQPGRGHDDLPGPAVGPRARR